MLFIPSENTPTEEGRSFILSMRDSTFSKCRDTVFCELTKIRHCDMYDLVNFHAHVKILFEDHREYIHLPVTFDFIENKPVIKYPLFFDNSTDKVQFAIFHGFLTAKRTMFQKLQPSKPLWNDNPTVPFKKRGLIFHVMYLVNRTIAPKKPDHKLFWCIILEPTFNTRGKNAEHRIIIQAEQCYETASEAKLDAFSYLMQNFALCGPPRYHVVVKIRHVNPHSIIGDKCRCDRLLKSNCISEAVFYLFPRRICCCPDLFGHTNCLAHTYQLSFKATALFKPVNMGFV